MGLSGKKQEQHVYHAPTERLPPLPDDLLALTEKRKKQTNQEEQPQAIYPEWQPKLKRDRK